ncbi:MAG TPA: SRPBCC family protein [Candidatus Acidoferrales bacterium]|nr:SRPBCC family protein [Candidatus Acidoferrales bacterium]
MKCLASEHADIHAPAESVFDYVMDLGRWPTWLWCVVSAVQPEHKPLARGVDVHVCMHAGRRRWQENLEITRFIRNAFLSFEAFYSAARRIDFRFERRGHVTRLACTVGYPVYGGGLPALYHAIVGRRRLSGAVRRSLVHLKNILEERAGDTTQADGFFEESAVGDVRPAVAAQGVRVG